MASMMSRGHGHTEPHGGHAGPEELRQDNLPIDELRRQRDKLDQLIASREQAEDSPTPGER
jgi:hypothetical protein